MSEAPDQPTEDLPVDDQPQPEQNDEPSGDDAAAAQGDDEAKAKPRRSAQERIDKAVAAQREAERNSEYWREQAMRGQQPPAPVATRDATEPKADDFDGGVYDPAYIHARISFEAGRVVAQQLAEREAQTRTQTARQQFDQKAAELYPDGEPEGLSALRRASNIPAGIAEPIFASPIGPKLADHLGAHPGELSRLSALSLPMQAYEIAKLEQQLSGPPKANPATNAPPATPQLRGAGGKFVSGPSDTDSVDDWLTKRNAEVKALREQGRI